MTDTAKRAALIAEGMTEGEADFMLSGGAKAEGLTPPADPAASPQPAPAAPAASETAPQPAAAQASSPQAPAQAPAEDDEPEPARDSAYYPQWQREKKRRQQLQSDLRARDDRLAQQDQELAKRREDWARLDERLSIFRQAAEPPPQQPRAKPDRESDPFGYMAWLEDQVESLKPQVQQVATQVQESEAATALRNSYVEDARAFARATPEFGQAYNWLMANRLAELEAAGYADQAERMRIVALDERDIVARALEARKTNPNAPGPAQIVYGLAKARGFVARPVQQNGAAGAPATNGAATHATNGAATSAPSVTQQVEQIQRGQAASRSLSNVGGSPAPQAIDLSRLANMSDAEYLDWKRSLTPAQHKELNSLLGAA